MSTRTFCRILSQNDFHGEISAQKSAPNKKTNKNLVAFAKAEGGFLKRILQIQITSQLLQILQETYWSPRGSKCTQNTVKLVPVWALVWGSIQYGSVQQICMLEGNINSLKYSKVLATSYIPKQPQKESNFASTSKLIRAKKMKVLQDWPAQSPEMNIIEHVWGRMKEEA